MSKLNTLLILCLLVLVYDLRSKRPVTKVTHMNMKCQRPNRIEQAVQKAVDEALRHQATSGDIRIRAQ